MKMKRFAIVLSLLAGVFGAAGALDMPGTAAIGGVDLFDADSPVVGIQNPALLFDYGRIDPAGLMLTNTNRQTVTNIGMVGIPLTNAVTVTNRVKGKRQVRTTNVIVLSNAVVTNVFITNTVAVKPAPLRHHVGRFHLLSTSVQMAATGDLLSSSRYYVGMFRGSLGTTPPDQADALRTAFLIASFGLIDLQPVFDTNKATTYDIVSNLIAAAQYSDSGFYLGSTVNILSFNRDRFGLAVLAEGEAYGGTIADSKNILFLINDPIFRISLRLGGAVSFSPGEFDLPLIGKSAVGFTARVYPYILEAKADTIADYSILQQQFMTYSTNGMDETAFGDGRLVRMGLGLSADAALIRNVTPDFQITLKATDILSPRYWHNSKEFGWVLPDLSFGLRYVFPVGGTARYFIYKPSLYFQIDDLLYTQPKSLLAKIKMGADSLFLLDILRLGVGLNAGYPTLGATLHLPLFFVHLKIYASLYGKELGLYPGDFGFQGYNVGLEFFLGF